MMDKTEFQKKIGERLVELRKAKEITQAELARRAFKDRQNISDAEKGGFSHGAYFLYEIATALDIEMSEIFIGLDK